MTYAEAFNIRTRNVKFNDVTDAIDGTLMRSYGGTTTAMSAAYISSPTASWTAYDTVATLTITPHIVSLNYINKSKRPFCTISINLKEVEPLEGAEVHLVGDEITYRLAVGSERAEKVIKFVNIPSDFAESFKVKNLLGVPFPSRDNLVIVTPLYEDQNQ